MRLRVRRLLGLAAAALLAFGAAFVAWLFLLAPQGEVSTAASMGECLRGTAPPVHAATAACVMHEHLVLTVPLVLAALVAFAGLAGGRPRAALSGALMVGVAWLPWGAFHVLTRGLDHAGAWRGVGQFALVCLAGALAIAWSARGLPARGPVA